MEGPKVFSRGKTDVQRFWEVMDAHVEGGGNFDYPIHVLNRSGLLNTIPSAGLAITTPNKVINMLHHPETVRNDCHNNASRS